MRRDPFEGLRRSKRRAFVFLLRRLVRIVYGDGNEPDVIFEVCVGEALLHCQATFDSVRKAVRRRALPASESAALRRAVCRPPRMPR